MPSDLAGHIALPYQLRGNSSIVESDIAFIIEKVMNVDGGGAYSGKDLISMIKARGEMDKLISVYTTTTSVKSTQTLLSWENQEAFRSELGLSSAVQEVSLSEVLGADSKSIDSGRPVTIIMCETPFVSPCMRDAHIVSMFLSSIPSHIMSMAVPYLSVDFQFDRGIIDPEKFNVTAPNILRFLMGARAGQNSQGSADKIIAGSLCRFNNSKNAKGDEESKLTETTFNDIFCAPQTLTSFDRQGSDTRYNTLLDPSRPFASLETLNISITPTFGFQTFKKGTLIFTVHDRSRLADIADLIRPSEFSHVTCNIQYGWQFPEKIFDSVAGSGYRDLINSMMSPREAYGVSNASLSTDGAGQVKVTLDLFTKSQMYSQSATINIDGLERIYATLAESVEFIKKYREKLGLGEPEGMTKEIRVHQLLNAAAAGTVPELKDAEVKLAYEDLQKALAGVQKSSSADMVQTITTFLQKVKDVSGSGQKDSYNDEVKLSVASAVSKRIAKLSGPDPWLPQKESDPFFKPVSEYNKIMGSNDQKKKETLFKIDAKNLAGTPATNVKGVCSLTKLLSVFILEPFRHINHEVQLIFHTFNDHAGMYAEGKNIGRFPIELNVFTDRFYKTLTAMGKSSMTIEEFFGFVFNTMVNDNFSLGYGLRNFYEPYDGSNTPTLKEDKTPKGSNVTAKLATYESTMVEYAQQNGDSWKTPQIEVYIETVNVRAADQGAGSTDASKDSNTVPSTTKQLTRIHIHDKQANPYRAVQVAVEAVDGSKSTGIVNLKKLQVSGKSVNNEGVIGCDVILNALNNITKKKLLDDSNSVSITAYSDMTNQKFKDVISSLVPTLVYGSNASGILNASLTSKADSLLSTINMTTQKRDPKNSTQPNGSAVGNLPVQVIPATMSMTTFGCPKLQPAQIYFADFNTGTSMDNLYILTTLSHTIGVGKFESSAQFGFQDGYAQFRSPRKLIDVLQDQAKWAGKGAK